MGQRLGIAAALLGDPHTLILDEPVNGLDPEGIHWIRNLLKGLAAEGRTVFVSSHLMSEMALTADHLIVIGRGRLIADTERRRVRPPRLAEARARPLAAGARGSRDAARGPGRHGHGRRARRCSRSAGSPPSRSASAAAATGIVLHELTPQQASLEEAFMDADPRRRRVQGRRGVARDGGGAA